MTDVKELGPLDYRIAITDQQGRPSPEFQRRWDAQRVNNGLFITLTFGTGAPTGSTDKDGSEYIDTSTTPYTLYVVRTGAWHKVGPYAFTDLSDVPHSYSGAGLKLVRVNAGATALEFSTIAAALDSIGSVQGDILYRNATGWTVLPPGTASQLLQTGGASANPSWVNAPISLPSIANNTLLANTSGSAAVPVSTTLTALIDSALGSAQGDIIYRSASGWVVLTPGTSGYLLATGGASANPSWTAPIAAANPSATASDTAVNGSATTFMRSDASPAIQKASSSVFGLVKVDGTTITASSGVISSVGASGANPTATASDTAVNGSAATFMRSDASPAVQKASSSVFGLVKVDGTTITATGGVISGTASVSGANPTATASDTAVNGSASTFMRSDAAPAIQKTSSSVFGLAKVDGTTIIATGGVISSTGGSGTVTTTSSPTSGNLTKFSGATSITNGDLSGDVTTSGTLVTTLANSGVTAATYGDSAHVSRVTVDTKGRITSASSVAISGAGGGSNLVLLESHTASSSASLAFTTAFSSTYDTYQVEIIGLVPATNGVFLNMQMSTNGGSSYDSGSNYEYALNYTSTAGATGNPSSTSTTAIQVFGTISNTTTGGLSATGRINSVASTALHKPVHFTGNAFVNDNHWYRFDSGGAYRSTTAVNAVQFLMSSGNIASGTIRIYGVGS